MKNYLSVLERLENSPRILVRYSKPDLSENVKKALTLASQKGKDQLMYELLGERLRCLRIELEMIQADLEKVEKFRASLAEKLRSSGPERMLDPFSE